MPFLDTNSLPVIERLPGWRGRYFHSQNMTFAHYDFERGASIHEHFHAQEEVYEVIEGSNDGGAGLRSMRSNSEASLGLADSRLASHVEGPAVHPLDTFHKLLAAARPSLDGLTRRLGPSDGSAS